MLDTARLRDVLSRKLDVAPQSIHAQVVGEHGDSEVVLWSSARVAGVPLARWPGWDANEQPLIANEVRTAADQIIRRKGATNHAIGLVTARLLSSIVRDEKRVLTVSRVQNGTLGIRDVCSLAADDCRRQWWRRGRRTRSERGGASRARSFSRHSPERDLITRRRIADRPSTCDLLLRFPEVLLNRHLIGVQGLLRELKHDRSADATRTRRAARA